MLQSITSLSCADAPETLTSRHMTWRARYTHWSAAGSPLQGWAMALLDGIDELDTAAAQTSPLSSRDAFGAFRWQRPACPSVVLRGVFAADVASGVVRLASRAALQAVAHLAYQAVHDRP